MLRAPKAPNIMMCFISVGSSWNNPFTPSICLFTLQRSKSKQQWGLLKACIQNHLIYRADLSFRPVQTFCNFCDARRDKKMRLGITIGYISIKISGETWMPVLCTHLPFRPRGISFNQSLSFVKQSA